MKIMIAYLQRHALVGYFILAIIFSWLIGLPLVAMRQGWIEAKIPYSIHIE